MKVMVKLTLLSYHVSILVLSVLHELSYLIPTLSICCLVGCELGTVIIMSVSLKEKVEA